MLMYGGKPYAPFYQAGQTITGGGNWSFCITRVAGLSTPPPLLRLSAQSIWLLLYLSLDLCAIPLSTVTILPVASNRANSRVKG